MRTPPAALLAARRNLDALPEVEMLEDLTWSEQLERWELKVRLTLPGLPEGPVPQMTDWYFLISDDYPEGSIYPLPAKQQGLKGIFPHQGIEIKLGDDKPYTGFVPCLRPSVTSLGRAGMSPEPMSADWRLYWRMKRLRLWLELAARGELLGPGEPFELPWCDEKGPNVVYAEGADTFTAWQHVRATHGLLDLLMANKPELELYVSAFRAPDGSLIHRIPWGDKIRAQTVPGRQSIWLRIPTLPVLPPWQYPTTWDDLRITCRAMGINLDSHLRKALEPIRDGHPHMVLLGYPIPAVMGEASVEYRWHALMMPGFRSQAGIRRPRTYSTCMIRTWAQDRDTNLASETALTWCASPNWHRDRLSVRGRLCEGLREAKVLIIGTGAVGSHLAETLARGGVSHFILVDKERLEIGNLARHTLTLSSLDKSKAAGLAERLRSISPFIKVKVVSENFPPTSPATEHLLRSSRLVIDCSAEDRTLRAMSRFTWQEHTQFFSVSLGFAGQRLFLFQANGSHFPEPVFTTAITPWLETEADERAQQDLPWQGAGCWHPYFPAREDDVQMMTATAVRAINDSVERGSYVTRLTVYAQNSRGGQFEGVCRVALPAAA